MGVVLKVRPRGSTISAVFAELMRDLDPDTPIDGALVIVSTDVHLVDQFSRDATERFFQWLDGTLPNTVVGLIIVDGADSTILVEVLRPWIERIDNPTGQRARLRSA